MASPSLAESTGPRSLPKGRQTKAAIVDAALRLATRVGLEGLSIGAVAETTGLSKSGVFAHFGSREALQLSVVREYHDRFAQEVFAPILTLPRGLPRLQALFVNWVRRTSAEIDAGCLYIGGAAEFDDRPGPVRDALVQSVNSWLGAMQRAVTQACEEGHLGGEVDAAQLVFEIHGLILALQFDARFLQSKSSLHRAQQGFDRLLARHAAMRSE